MGIVNDDLISRAEAIGAFTGNPPDYYSTSYIVSELSSVPAVDAVPVIRCKDCEFWNYKDCVVEGNFYCDMLERYTLENFYCAAGIRRDADEQKKAR